MVGNATLAKRGKLILGFWIFCLGGIVRRWGSGWGQGERLVNLGHNQPSLNQVSEVPDHELILNKTNKRATLSDFIMMRKKSNRADIAISPSIDQTKMIDTPTLDWIIGGGGI